MRASGRLCPGRNGQPAHPGAPVAQVGRQIGHQKEGGAGLGVVRAECLDGQGMGRPRGAQRRIGPAFAAMLRRQLAEPQAARRRAGPDRVMDDLVQPFHRAIRQQQRLRQWKRQAIQRGP